MSIVLQGVTCRFAGLPAVRNVSLEVRPGGLVGLVGPVGAGKSTLLRLMGALLIPDAGDVTVFGTSSRRDPSAIRRRVGYVPQAALAGGAARVDETLRFSRAALKNISRRQRTAEVDRVLADCGLLSVRRRVISRLSHGFQRRVSLAEALLGNPPLLLLDEPTAGLDVQAATDTCQLLRQVSESRLVALSTHDLAEAEACCRRVVVMTRGQVLREFLPHDWSAGLIQAELQAPENEVHDWLRANSIDARVTSLDSGWLRIKIPDAAGSGTEHLGRQCRDARWTLRELRPVQQSLGELVSRLIQESHAVGAA